MSVDPRELRRKQLPSINWQQLRDDAYLAMTRAISSGDVLMAGWRASHLVCVVKTREKCAPCLYKLNNYFRGQM